MSASLLTVAIVLVLIAIVFGILGFIGRIAWAIAKWLIVICIILAIVTYLLP